MTNEELAKKILDLVGGKDNVRQLTNCVTRLRFSLKDEAIAKTAEIEALPGVIGVQKQGGQYQVILGGKVVNVAAELRSKYQLGSSDEVYAEKEKLSFNSIISTLSAILTPSLPPVIAGGMLKGFVFMFTNFGWVDASSDTVLIMNLISDCMFYFFPFLLASSSAKRFQTNEYMALAIAGALMYPTILDAANLGEISSFSLFGFIPVAVVNYSSSVIPIILSVLLLKYVFNFFNKYIPEMVRSIFSPLFTLVITIIVSLVVLAPLGFYIGDYVAKGTKALIDFSPILSGFVIGATRPFLVLLGVHHAMNPIMQQEVLSFGASSMLAMVLMSVVSQATAAFAVYVISKDKNTKQIAISSAISGYVGITEPALYGVIMKSKEIMVATFLGGGIGAAIGAAMGAKCYGFVMPGVLSLPAFMGDGFTGVIIGMIVSAVITFAIIFVFKNKINDVKVTAVTPNKEQESNEEKVVKSPITGAIKDIKTVSDQTFANESVGKGVAIEPKDGNVYSPITGEVVVSFKTKHAIGLKGDNGVEVLLHAGIDTVNLEGKHFDVKVKEGQRVAVGDLLMTYDYETIKNEGYDPVMLVVITNTQDYLDVLPYAKGGDVTHGDNVLSVL